MPLNKDTKPDYPLEGNEDTRINSLSTEYSGLVWLG